MHIRVVQIKEPKSGTCITAKILEEGNEKVLRIYVAMFLSICMTKSSLLYYELLV